MGMKAVHEYFLTCEVAEARVLSLHMPVCLKGHVTAAALEELLDAGATVLLAPDVDPHLIERFGGRLWGALTHRPIEHAIAIPTWRPLVDGPDRLQELLRDEERIALDLTRVPPQAHVRLVATAALYASLKHRWLHVHGAPFDERVVMYAVDSCDSDSWKHGARWKGVNEYIGGVPFSRAEKLVDPLDDDASLEVCAVAARAHVANWRHIAGGFAEA
jgi:hypothetical protein